MTPKQEKLIKLLSENSLNEGETKTLETMLLEAGYTQETALSASHIVNSPTIQDALAEVNGDFAEELDKKRRLAMKHLTEKKLEVTNAKDLSQIADTLTKNHQLLTGKATEKVTSVIEEISYLSPVSPEPEPPQAP